jgi:hypothetical protein
MLAAGRKAARHLDEERDADRSEENGPRELIAEPGSRLRRRRNRSDLEKTADARDDPKRNLQKLFQESSRQ